MQKALLAVDSAMEWLRLCNKGNNKSLEGLIRGAKAEAGFDPEWTADVIDLIELSMELHERGAVNQGKVPIKAVVTFFFALFGLKPGNFFSSYGVMRTRAGSRTRFLDELKLSMENKMDRDDAKEMKRK